MKILIVTQYFWPETFCINDLAAGLVDRGNSVEVLTGIPNYPDGRFFKGYGLFKREVRAHCGITIHRVPIVPRRNGRFMDLILNYLSFVLSACLLGPFLCRGNYDHIIVYEPSPITVGLPAILLKWLKGCHLIFWVQDLWPESLSATGVVRSHKILNIVARLVRFIYSRCDRILVPSRAFIPSIEKHGVDVRKIMYFPNMVDGHYRPLPVDADDRIALPEGFVVMFAGNVGDAQDFPTILGAAERLKAHKNIHFVIIGNGRMHGWVRDNVSEMDLGGTVHLLGRHPNELIPQFCAAADVMLVTLKKEPIFALTIPAKVQAYLACGRPVIAALEGETARIIEESGAGVACAAQNPDKLAEAILEMHNRSAEEQREMGRRARLYYESNFESGRLLDCIENLMADMRRPVLGKLQKMFGNSTRRETT